MGTFLFDEEDVGTILKPKNIRNGARGGNVAATGIPAAHAAGVYRGLGPVFAREQAQVLPARLE